MGRAVVAVGRRALFLNGCKVLELFSFELLAFYIGRSCGSFEGGLGLGLEEVLDALVRPEHALLGCGSALVVRCASSVVALWIPCLGWLVTAEIVLAWMSSSIFVVGAHILGSVIIRRTGEARGRRRRGWDKGCCQVELGLGSWVLHSCVHT